MSERQAVVQVQVNGEPHTIPGGQLLEAFIANLGLPPQTTLVEYNGHALFRTDWDKIHLSVGDRLEILQVAAGG